MHEGGKTDGKFEDGINDVARRFVVVCVDDFFSSVEIVLV